jgi:thiol:disulfide interchange protein DsbD
VLGTFSNLLQTLPRSGEWMVWVKKVFGVILVAVGLFYALLALAPSLAFWVIPAVLIVGGLYLGFFEKSAAKRPGFQRLKWATGTLAVIAGVALVATTPRGGLAFRPYDDALVLGDLPRSRPVMLDFSANWCVPCHELERSTFTDARVIAAGRSFDAFKVDLTRYDSPEADALRKRFGIRGVPTVVFLDTSGREIEGARVEGFLAPGPFLERMKTAAAAGARAAAE